MGLGWLEKSRDTRQSLEKTRDRTRPNPWTSLQKGCIDSILILTGERYIRKRAKVDRRLTQSMIDRAPNGVNSPILSPCGDEKFGIISENQKRSGRDLPRRTENFGYWLKRAYQWKRSLIWSKNRRSKIAIRRSRPGAETRSSEQYRKIRKDCMVTC